MLKFVDVFLSEMSNTSRTSKDLNFVLLPSPSRSRKNLDKQISYFQKIPKEFPKNYKLSLDFENIQFPKSHFLSNHNRLIIIRGNFLSSKIFFFNPESQKKQFNYFHKFFDTIIFCFSSAKILPIFDILYLITTV